MKNINYIFFLPLFLLISDISLGQEKKDILPRLFFKNAKISNYSFIPPNSTSFIENQGSLFRLQIIKPLDNSVHYTAFFCNMEVKTFERCNVWVKFHAGDYDTYSK